MKRILIVGEHPHCSTGNGRMLNALLDQIDTDEYTPICFVHSPYEMEEQNAVLTQASNYTIINANEPNDPRGRKRLLRAIQKIDFDILLFVGVDLWQYSEIFDSICSLRDQKSFKWVALFPYDFDYVRDDLVSLINKIDVPLVYSKQGETVLKDHVPNIAFFRPSLHDSELFKPLDGALELRKLIFPMVDNDTCLFGFVGKNQIRKDPQRLLSAFKMAKDQLATQHPHVKIALYLHTELDGVFDLRSHVEELGFVESDIICKHPQKIYSNTNMAKMYNALDCLINCTMQEGLSWTPLEAMCCATPVILSGCTAHLDYDPYQSVECVEHAYLPILRNGKRYWVDSQHCNASQISDAIVAFAKQYYGIDSEMNLTLAKESAYDQGQYYIDHADDINLIFDETVREQLDAFAMKEALGDCVLFLQYGSAGDVLMTTQCFKGILENHPGKKLVYMTQNKFSGVLKGNPYISLCLDWDLELASKFDIIYKPHADKILPGGFNTLDVSLPELYPYFCGVEADELSIMEEKPSLSSDEEWFVKGAYIVVNTSGASEYRRYEHMSRVFEQTQIPIVQIGSWSDPPLSIPNKYYLDLRSKLSFTESAWIMSNAKLAVTMDSFPAHLAGAVGTPLIALYGPAPARVTAPRVKDPNHLICLAPDMLAVCELLCHCWSTGLSHKKKCTTPCINTISPARIHKAVIEMLERISG